MSGVLAAISARGAGALQVTISPAGASGFRMGKGTVVSNSVTAMITGGTGPYTIVWTRDSGSTAIVPPANDNPSGTFSVFIGAPPDTITAQYYVVVTDALSTVVNSNTIPVTLEAF